MSLTWEYLSTLVYLDKLWGDTKGIHKDAHSHLFYLTLYGRYLTVQ